MTSAAPATAKVKATLMHGVGMMEAKAVPLHGMMRIATKCHPPPLCPQPAAASQPSSLLRKRREREEKKRICGPHIFSFSLTCGVHVYHVSKTGEKLGQYCSGPFLFFGTVCDSLDVVISSELIPIINSWAGWYQQH
jgi:hypothetical protein